MIHAGKTTIATLINAISSSMAQPVFRLTNVVLLLGDIENLGEKKGKGRSVLENFDLAASPSILLRNMDKIT